MPAYIIVAGVALGIIIPIIMIDHIRKMRVRSVMSQDRSRTISMDDVIMPTDSLIR